MDSYFLTCINFCMQQQYQHAFAVPLGSVKLVVGQPPRGQCTQQLFCMYSAVLVILLVGSNSSTLGLASKSLIFGSASFSSLAFKPWSELRIGLGMDLMSSFFLGSC